MLSFTILQVRITFLLMKRKKEKHKYTCMTYTAFSDKDMTNTFVDSLKKTSKQNYFIKLLFSGVLYFKQMENYTEYKKNAVCM